LLSYYAPGGGKMEKYFMWKRKKEESIKGRKFGVNVNIVYMIL
jgi:hypothetical protein